MVDVPTLLPDRAAGGDVLAQELRAYADRDDVIVLGLPRGGVPVAARVAAALHAALDVVVVRKVGLPGRPELAMGAVAGLGGTIEIVRNEDVLERAHVDDAGFVRAVRREIDELRRREQLLRGSRPAPTLRDHVVIVVDDGLATGATMRAALTAVTRQHPARTIAAVPVGAAETCQALRTHAAEVVCPWTPPDFSAVGQYYRDFSATSEDEVRSLLARP